MWGSSVFWPLVDVTSIRCSVPLFLKGFNWIETQNIRKTLIEVIYGSCRLFCFFKVGDNARIAANAVVLSEVPDNATAVGAPAQIVRVNGEKVKKYVDEVDQTSVMNPTLEKLSALASRVEELEKKLYEKET